MNMFKSRRKAKDQTDTFEVASGRQTPLLTHRTVRSLKRKNKNTPEEIKPVFDLSSVLPEDNDFRTSLLMPQLSARFSMLREQDDPNTKIGKASDDSVLFPKRSSRLNLFGHYPLADITEVESIYSTFRPPFADRERASSVGDGYESDSGSVMSRARPIDASNFVGTRQKIHRMVTDPTHSFTGTDSTVASRHVSDHNTIMPQAQHQGISEKEVELSPIDVRDSIPTTDAGENSDVASPATAFSKNRETQSSTNSNTRRTSTAATSVASEVGVFRSSGTDSVRSKHQDGVVPTPESSSSLLVAKTREDAIPNRFATQSKTNRPSPIYGAALRNASSPPATASTQPLDFGFITDSRSASVAGRHPGETVSSATSDVLANSLQPSDRGKATALGLFNKPAREFDEDQFKQRQIQMHEDHVSSLSYNSRTTSLASADTRPPRQDSVTAHTNSIISVDTRSSAPQAPPVPTVASSTISTSNRASKASERSITARPRSRSNVSSTPIGNVRARVESLIRKHNAELTVRESEKLGPSDPSENKENLVRTFFDNEDEDEESDIESSRLFNSRIGSSQADESHIHPAFRNSYRVSEIQSRKSNYSQISKTRSILDDDKVVDATPPSLVNEPEQKDIGLSGLIRTHLRRDSDKSSLVLRPESVIDPELIETSQADNELLSPEATSNELQSNASAADTNKDSDESPRSPTLTTTMSQIAQHFLTQAMAIKDAADRERAEKSADNSPNSKELQDESESSHQRSESSETTKERREFGEKLAQRQRKIREGLKGVTERERSQSPTNMGKGQATAMHAFVQHRAVTDPQPKAMKMLGMSGRGLLPGPFDEVRGRVVLARNEPHDRHAETYFANSQLRAATYARFPESTPERMHSPRSRTPPSRFGRREPRSDVRVESRSKSRTRHEVSHAFPHPIAAFNNWNQPAPSPIQETFQTFDFDLGTKPAGGDLSLPPKDIAVGLPAHPSARFSPVSPQSPQTPLSPLESPVEAMRPTPASLSNGRATPSNGRTTPSNGRSTPMFSRKRSVNKHMISEPTFVSSTSSVPLVHLPDAQQTHAASAPPVPSINPRRRGNTTGEKPVLSPGILGFSRSTPLEPVPASPVVLDFGTEINGRKSPSPRKLRKATSDGGNMAAKARQQAMAQDFAHEKTKSPAIPIFPNRSATALGVRDDGAMF